VREEEKETVSGFTGVMNCKSPSRSFIAFAAPSVLRRYRHRLCPSFKLSFQPSHTGRVHSLGDSTHETGNEKHTHPGHT